MSRHQVVEGIILKTNRIAEIHKGLTLLTGNSGLLDCIAHGAWKEKSKLRGAAQLFGYATFYLYYNPVNKSYKVSDIVSKELFEKIRGSVRKYFIASLWAEIIIKSMGGGEHTGRLFRLFLQSLEYLHSCPDKEDAFILVQFLWRFMYISGFIPELNNCNECNKPVELSIPVYYEKSVSAFVCMHCVRDKTQPFNPGIRIYINKSLALPIKQALTLKIEKNAIESLKKITYHIVENHLEIRLNSLKSGEGII